MNDVRAEIRRTALPKCAAPMETIVAIAPIGGHPGLIAFKCPQCQRDHRAWPVSPLRLRKKS